MEIPKGFKPRKNLEKETQRLLEEEPRKIREEKEVEERVLYKNIVYGNLRFDEFSKCNYPEEKIEELKISFKHKKLSFEAVHEPYDEGKRTKVYLKLPLKYPKTKISDRITLYSVLMKYKFYYSPTPKPKKEVYKRYYNAVKGRMESQYRYEIGTPDVVFFKLELLRDIEGFYQKHFKDVALQVSYKNITAQEYDHATLPAIKIRSKDGIQILV